MKIWVDADACPVKNEIERLAAKRGMAVVHVCALEGFRREAAGVEVVIVREGPDAADEWILSQCSAGELVVTSDVPLAVEALRLGAFVIDFRGGEMTPETAPLRSSLRDLTMARMDRGEPIRGPSPQTASMRRDFAGALARVLDRMAVAAARAAAARERDAATRERDGGGNPAG